MYSIILFITSLFVYLRTLVPTVYVGDSGELITGAAILGIAHPPGVSIILYTWQGF